MQKSHFFILLLFFTSYVAFAQRINFPDSPQEFVAYVNDQLTKGKQVDVANDFSSAWSSGLSAHQTKIIQVSKKLVTAKMIFSGGFTDFFGALANASNSAKANATQIGDFLNVCEQATALKDTRDLNTFLKKSRYFFLKFFIVSEKLYRAYVTQGDYKFIYLDKRDEALQTEFASVDSDSLAQVTKDLLGPMIKFNNANFSMGSTQDSVTYKGTKAVWLMTKNTLVGKGGKVDWKSVEFDENKVFTELSNYTFDGSKNELKGSNATLTYTDVLKKSIKGDYTFASRPRKNANYAVYPKFVSNEHNVEIPNISQNIDYKGGFSLEGRKIISTSKQGNLYSYLIGKSGFIDNNKKSSFLIASRKLAITDSTISTNNAKFSLYMGAQDSLYHSDLQLNYYRSQAQKKEKKYDLRLVRDRNTASGSTPFIDNHHEFYIDADVVRYNIEKDSLDLFMLTGSQDLRPAVFESFDFFDKERYNQMIGLYSFHPLRLFGEFARKNKTNIFSVAEVAKDIADITKELAKKQGKKDVDLRNLPNEGALRNLATELRSKGYLDFDEGNGFITMGRRISQADSTDVFLSSVDKIQRKIAKKNDSTLYKTYDHDTFLIKSVSGKQPNASMSRTNNELLIRGIDRFPISQLLNVNIIPDTSKREVKIYQGRSLYLDKGEVTVGNFRFIGQKFFMLYKDFAVEMPIIDKILFIIADTTDDKKIEFHEYGGEISFQPGRVVISDHLNKSGRKKGKILGTKNSYEEYPKLMIENGGLTYFKTKDRQNMAYDSLVVNIPQEFEEANDVKKLKNKHGAVFVLDPIDMDSLTSKVPIFPGRFVSNILPTFKEKLKPMPDYSMGFIHKAPKAGYPLYPISDQIKGAKIKFSRDLVMTKEALSTGGEISYLSTILKSPEFVLMPDSVTSDNIEFNVAKAKIGPSEYPESTGQTAQLRWNATEDKMIITNKTEIERLEGTRASLPKGAFEQRFKDKLFTIYGKANPVTLRGNLIVGANGLTAEGALVRKDFTILSVSEDKFTLGQNGFVAKNIELRINSKPFDPYVFDQFFYVNNKPIMRGNFVNTVFDFIKGQTDIKPSEDFGDEFASMEFPYAEYKTSIKDALWDLNKQTIAMKGDTNSRFTATIFGTEENNTENLTFRANQALYDIPNLTLLTKGVPNIYSADAMIIPKDGIATILKDAEMQELKEARIFMDTTNRYHKLFNATIRIKSRIDFDGDATYQFVNVKKDTFNIKFDKFQFLSESELAGKEKDAKKKRRKKREKEETRFTYAEGTVGEDDKKKFYITSRILYKGKVKMRADKKDLGLEGFIKLDLASRKDFDQWLPYKSNKGDEVSLEVEEKQKIDNNIITSGLHFNSGFDLYSTFLSPKPQENDLDIFLAKGTLGYNPAINQFKIASLDKIEGKTFTGNLLIFDDSENSIYVEGKLNLFDKTLAKIVNKSGSVKIDNKNKKYNLDLLLVFDLPFSSKVNKELDKVMLSKFSEKPLNLNANDPLNYKIAEIVGEKSYRSYTDDFKAGRNVTAWKDKEMKKAFTFSKVDMQWSEEFKTFYSVGKLNLLSIFDKIWQLETPGYIELKKSTEGDSYSFYIQPKSDFWLYVEYEKEKFQVLSSDDLINKGLKSKNIEEAGVDKKDAFLAKFREVYKAE
ncbi:MAG: hypothetical protein EAZ20_08695, partial [Bacteroidetes bacterium]